LSKRRRIAVLVPCLNESATIADVITGCRTYVPDAAIYVIDNGSSDDTIGIARAAGAEVIVERRRGKGRALRTGFGAVDADFFVLVDGDGQMPLDRIPALLQPILAGHADMVVGSRSLGRDDESRFVNRLGNWAFSLLLRTLLRVRLTDVLSGFRAVSVESARALPLAADGFEIEVELTIKAAQRRQRIVELPIAARARPAGGSSRLRVVRDGLRILGAIAVLLLHGHPLRFFGAIGVALLAAAFSMVLYGTGSSAKSPVDSGVSLALLVIGGVLATAGLASIVAGVLLSPVARRLGSEHRRAESLPESASHI
jgi:glycosyltransferase involved in cell wall biosynthesis